MSIVVSVKVRDGIVLGTDSMSQIYMKDDTGRVGVAQTYSNARKLFQVAGLNIGVMSYGAGNIGTRSVQGLLEDFNDVVGEEKEKSGKTPSVKNVTLRLLRFLQDIYNVQLSDVKEAEKPLVGIFLGGYSPHSAFPEEWEFQIPRKPKAVEVRPKESFGASWRGVSLPFTRLHMGFDPRARDKLKELGVDENIIKQAIEPLKSPIAYDAIPLQDAVNFAYHILRTTVDHTTFELGPPSCGGPLDIAIVTKLDGFNWVTERKLTIPAS